MYNVPLGGALFTLEILLASAALADVIPALLSSGLATAVAWTVLSNRPTYLVAASVLHAPLLVWAVLVGPLAGLVGGYFVRFTMRRQLETARSDDATYRDQLQRSPQAKLVRRPLQTPMKATAEQVSRFVGLT